MRRRRPWVQVRPDHRPAGREVWLKRPISGLLLDDGMADEVAGHDAGWPIHLFNRLARVGRQVVVVRQLEAARIAVTRAMKREGQVWIRIFPDKPITRKPAEVRMGKGKGAPEYWVAVIKPGTILFEAGGVNIATAKEAMRLAEGKLPMKTKFTIKRDYVE